MMDEREWLTERFERHRSHLRASPTECSVRSAKPTMRSRKPGSGSAARIPRVENMQAWLTTVVGRVCLNMLRSRRARREELSVHVPDPVVAFEEDADPEHQTLLAESVGLALLVVLDALTPAERLAFVLHDVFGVPFTDIARALDRSEAAAQQLASRARRHARGSPEPDPDLARQREVVDAFFAASRDGDFDALVAMLDPDVKLRIDGGVQRAEASLILRGAKAVAGHTATYSKLYPFIRPALVNGAAGAVVAPHGQLFSVMAFTVTDGKITQIDALVDPDRLAQLDLTFPDASP